MSKTNKSGLMVADALIRFIEDRALPGTGVEAEHFWAGMADIFTRFAPENASLLAIRARMEQQIDNWHRKAGGPGDAEEYRSFLREIGYLVPEPDSFAIASGNVDAEIATIAGPQLVVPILNTRFLLNAANARWGSLYDALYGTDAIPGEAGAKAYDPERGAQVIDWVRAFLDETVPLLNGSWKEWQGDAPQLAEGAELVAMAGDNYLLRHHGLHIELVIDRDHPIGKDDPAGLADVLMEAATSTICDLEDSVAAVDTEDKVAGYANWLGLLQGDLEASFEKGGRVMTRRLNPDRTYKAADGSDLVLHGRSLLLVRNVGHLMTTPAVHLPDGSEAPEGILDAIVTSLIGMHDLQGDNARGNSRTGSIYIVKPKMHGPEEAAFTNRLFDATEDLLGLARNTIKVGVMDEERRTSANLAACIHAVKDRVFFINTGFLDRTGDEIHTSMQAGPMVRKGDMKSSRWITAYEDRNVQIGLACGFTGKAQIGKGMWAAPDRMADMLDQKIGHPLSGATTAWVPSPTAAVLHATHYHAVDVAQRQTIRAQEEVISLDALLTLPVAASPASDGDTIREELENNAQGILGYVVRWVDQGVGCSKVPDIHDIGLMEDRATLRISSQHMANWLLHGICTAEEVDAAFQRMAAKVDAQNAGDPAYMPMAGNEASSLAYQAARALVFDGIKQPNGYTEPLLHRYRQIVKRGVG
ncbi:malate synthase G [Altericroceibacterium spongiae]|uniref:Malate synthase G n=1 Tax=Altericroceibacterium spongiae TaxID=2320269 RepID=A0A420EP52_9SPHN|nr:malate synthase G [Altericroceibacterium spongiae]RKF22459.1 malate synthase G [Altericroceibacterium spongiae]